MVVDRGEEQAPIEKLTAGPGRMGGRYKTSTMRWFCYSVLAFAYSTEGGREWQASVPSYNW